MIRHVTLGYLIFWWALVLYCVWFLHALYCILVLLCFITTGQNKGFLIYLLSYLFSIFLCFVSDYLYLLFCHYCDYLEYTAAQILNFSGRDLVCNACRSHGLWTRSRMRNTWSVSMVARCFIDSVTNVMKLAVAITRRPSQNCQELPSRCLEP